MKLDARCYRYKALLKSVRNLLKKLSEGNLDIVTGSVVGALFENIRHGVLFLIKVSAAVH